MVPIHTETNFLMVFESMGLGGFTRSFLAGFYFSFTDQNVIHPSENRVGANVGGNVNSISDLEVLGFRPCRSNFAPRFCRLADFGKGDASLRFFFSAIHKDGDSIL